MAKKVVKTIQGYEVIKPYREWAISYLKTYPTLRRSHDSLETIDGLKNGWSEKVISKAAIESHITLMEEALSQIPECYRKAVLHTFSGKPSEDVRSDIEYIYQMDYGDVMVFREKLIYFVAKGAGFPVSEKGEKREIEVQSNGEIIFVCEE